MANTKSKKENTLAQSSLAAAFNSVAGNAPTTPTEQSSEQKPEKDYEHFNFICDKLQKQKVLALAKQTGFSIKDVMSRAIGDFISRYEEKNGNIDVNASKSLDAFL